VAVVTKNLIVLHQHLLGGTEENPKMPQSEWLALSKFRKQE